MRRADSCASPGSSKTIWKMTVSNSSFYTDYKSIDILVTECAITPLTSSLILEIAYFENYFFYR